MGKKYIIELKEMSEAIEWFKNRSAVMLESETKEMFRMAISALKKQEKDRWIPITERLPEEDCSCRVTEGDFKSVLDCHWSNHKKQFEIWSDYLDDYLPITNVTAWKFIEEPYTEEENHEM